MGTTTEIVCEHDLAADLGISVWTLRTWRRRGYGPAARKLGKRVVYLRADVAAFIGDAMQPEGMQ